MGMQFMALIFICKCIYIEETLIVFSCTNEDYFDTYFSFKFSLELLMKGFSWGGVVESLCSLIVMNNKNVMVLSWIINLKYLTL